MYGRLCCRKSQISIWGYSLSILWLIVLLAGGGISMHTRVPLRLYVYHKSPLHAGAKDSKARPSRKAADLGSDTSTAGAWGQEVLGVLVLKAITPSQ